MEDSTERRVARILGRELMGSESAVYPDFDALPSKVTDIVGIIAMHDAILAGRYLRERLLDRGRTVEINWTLERLAEQWMARWTPGDEAAARRILGRELGSEKPATLAEMDDLSSQVRADAAKLGKQNFILACKYVLRRVPNLHLWGAMCWVEALPDSKPRGA